MEDEIIGIVPSMKKSKMLGMSYDMFTLIATPGTTVFAKVTSAMLNQVVKESREQAKAEGKGFFGQWGAQLSSTSKYAERYANMSAQAALAETPVNFAIPNSSISSIRVKKKSVSDGDDGFSNIWEVTIQHNSGKLKFKTDFDPKGHLQAIYGNRVN
ncbi:hypothetical protein [Methanolobus psychrotolerans]|uniref:hypothetical protein n=1 Tax=Methanolobus psychrotolerans TaxID=1874706 RepID=UPI000B9165FA|nr:hypothetical protein [Methanolobus psychrotolerans]